MIVIETYSSASAVLLAAPDTGSKPRTSNADVVKVGFHAPQTRFAGDEVLVAHWGARDPETWLRRTGFCLRLSRCILCSSGWGSVRRGQWIIVCSILASGRPVAILRIGSGFLCVLPLDGTSVAAVAAVGERHDVLVVWLVCWFVGYCLDDDDALDVLYNQPALAASTYRSSSTIVTLMAIQS